MLECFFRHLAGLQSVAFIYHHSQNDIPCVAAVERSQAFGVR